MPRQPPPTPALAGERGAGGSDGAPGQFGVRRLMLSALHRFRRATRPTARRAGIAPPSSTLPAQPAGEALPAAASWRSVSAVHSLGSGVLVALDKRFASTATDDLNRRRTPETKANASADAIRAGARHGRRSCELGFARDHAEATAVASSALTSARLARRGERPFKTQCRSDAAPALVATTPAPGPLAGKVVRSATYLGLDRRARNLQAAMTRRRLRLGRTRSAADRLECRRQRAGQDAASSDVVRSITYLGLDRGNPANRRKRRSAGARRRLGASVNERLGPAGRSKFVWRCFHFRAE